MNTNIRRMALAAVLLACLAIIPVVAFGQSLADGTTLGDFVLDQDGYAWLKAKPYGAKTLKPDPQARFIADPGNARGGNALHPQSHSIAEEVVKDAIKATGSDASFEIRWVDGVGLAGGYQVIVRSSRGQQQASAAQIAIDRMKFGRAGARQALERQLSGVL